MKRTLAACLILAVYLSSCASLLEREYTQAVTHEEDQVPPGDAAYRVETYPALRATILSCVEEGLEEGFLRCPTTYPGNLSVDLEKARRQLLEEEPLGCYALEDVDFNVTRIIAYYEVEMDFTYKVDPREIVGLPRANTGMALSQILSRSLEADETKVCVYLTAYPEGDREFFENALRTAYGISPDVLTRPDMQVTLYPDAGSRRVAVLELGYREDPAEREDRQAQLEERLSEILTEVGDEREAQDLFAALKERCHLSSSAGTTAYDALVLGRADVEGMTLGYAALCRRGGLSCRGVWTGTDWYAALTPRMGGAEGYVDLTAAQFALLETLPGEGAAP